MRIATLVLALAATTGAASNAQQEWSTIKGQVVWTGEKAPVIPPVANKGCPAPGPVTNNALIVNPKNKGVANVAVWLMAEDGKPIPIHLKLQAIPDKVAKIDQPCCLFEPRVTMIRAGQALEIHNSAAIGHNANLKGTKNNPPNLLIPPGGKRVFAGNTALVAEEKAIDLACNIHGWMGGKIYVFDHPYFAMTDENGQFEIKDAPVGKFRLLMQHEESGWLHTPRFADKEKKVGGRFGQPIEIPAGKALDIGKPEFKPEFLK